MDAPHLDLFAPAATSAAESIGERSVVLRGFALSRAGAVLEALDSVTAGAPFRHMITPGGFTMSVALTNCGQLGWITDRRGYRYSDIDPVSGRPWPVMPSVFRSLGIEAAAAAGFADFDPDACLVNRYVPGSKMSPHQDRDEQDFTQPIVSVSLGMPATFLFGGLRRADRSQRIGLVHGDVVVWGGVDRLRFHGVASLKDLPHPALGSLRINLTFRKAG